uniref:Fad oxidoreductase n=1 Tax=Rhizophora mucronata TaxID=61149 RepID=A0A2P2KND8_RHIMU
MCRQIHSLWQRQINVNMKFNLIFDVLTNSTSCELLMVALTEYSFHCR